MLGGDEPAVLAAAVAGVLAGGSDARLPVRTRDAMGLDRPLHASLCLVAGDPELVVATLGPDADQPHLPVGFDPARTLVALSDGKGTVLHVSRGANAVLGWTPAEVAERGAAGIVHPADLARFSATRDELRRLPGAVRTERVRVVAADGGTRWVRAVGMNLVEDPGVGGLVTCITDATGEVRAELQRRAAALAEARLLGDTTVGLTPEGTVTFVTDTAARMLGHRPEELLAVDLPARLADGAPLVDALARVADDRRRTRTVDVVLPSLHGPDRHLRATVRAGLAPTGEVSDDRGSTAAAGTTADAGTSAPGAGPVAGTTGPVDGTTGPVADPVGARPGAVGSDEAGPGLLVDLADLTERVQAHAAVGATERRYRKLVQGSTDVLTVIRPDLTVGWVSPAVVDVLGFAPEDLVGLPAESVVHPDDLPVVREQARNLGVEPGARASVRVRARHAEGGWRHLGLSGTDMSDDPDVGGLLLSGRDITAEVEAERARERLAQVLEASTDLVAIAHGGTGEIELNRAGRQVLGQDEPTIALEALAARTPPWVQRRVLDEVAPTLESSGIWEGELALHDHDGDVIPVSVVVIALRDTEGAIETIACVARDISDRKAFEDQLEHQATHDPLTGLPNRTLLLDRLRVAVGRAGRQSTRTAVLFLDLDNFKLINDSLGHAAGDLLLIDVARAIEGAVRPGDTVARFGGDEFAVLCEDLDDRGEALAIASRIEEAVGRPVELDGTEVMVTVSIGVATSDGRQEAESLMRDSDAAMYQAKARGRSRTEVFDRAMHVQAVDRLELETALRRALDRHEMRVAYQPQVDLRTGRLDGVEALLRWEHPERGILLPGEFLHIAEETGLIVAIGNWITAAACRAAARLHDLAPSAADIVVSVNLSARQLASPHLIDDVAAIVAAADLPPQALMLELTETVLMDVDASGEALTGLHRLGVSIAVDDFGTGWSSLRYLRDFPVDVLKVDRTFVTGLGRDSEDEAIVAAVIDLAHALGLRAVAEGVEDEIRLGRLRDLGCDSAQGWLLGRPMAEADLIDLVLAQEPGDGETSGR